MLGGVEVNRILLNRNASFNLIEEKLLTAGWQACRIRITKSHCVLTRTDRDMEKNLTEADYLEIEREEERV